MSVNYRCGVTVSKTTILTSIILRFQRTYQGRADTALPYAMNSEFSRVLAAEMVYKLLNFCCTDFLVYFLGMVGPVQPPRCKQF
jgi:hypothetical protein